MEDWPSLCMGVVSLAQWRTLQRIIWQVKSMAKFLSFWVHSIIPTSLNPYEEQIMLVMDRLVDMFIWRTQGYQVAHDGMHEIISQWMLDLTPLVLLDGVTVCRCLGRKGSRKVFPNGADIQGYGYRTHHHVSWRDGIGMGRFSFWPHCCRICSIFP